MATKKEEDAAAIKDMTETLVTDFDDTMGKFTLYIRGKKMVEIKKG